VVFSSAASNLVRDDINGGSDTLVRDLTSAKTSLVSRSSSGAQGSGGGENGESAMAVLSADGRHVAFASFADNLVPGDTSELPDVFVRDLGRSGTERVDVSTNGAQAPDGALFPSITAHGRWAAFESDSSNLVPRDTNGNTDVFLRDRG
jgi:Tol biopolymer transport system component